MIAAIISGHVNSFKQGEFFEVKAYEREKPPKLALQMNLKQTMKSVLNKIYVGTN
jgi:hypothetical protein